MEKMKAFVRTSQTVDTVEFLEVDIPEFADDEVLIKVEAFGVGIHDRYFIPRDASFPYTIGSEGAGIIERVGKDVQDFKVGQHVIFSSSLQPQGGCWAEYVAVTSDKLLSLPEDITFIEGAAIPVAGKTAIEALNAADVKKGETLFIAGASGAIGTLIIQLAKNLGINVIGLASRKNQNYMKSLGADDTADYQDLNWKNNVLKAVPNGVDTAIAIQPGTAKECIDIVKSDGRIISVSGDQTHSERNISIEQFQHKLSIKEALMPLLEVITNNHLKIVIEEIYAFEDALYALEKTETRHARGKLVVSM